MKAANSAGIWSAESSLISFVIHPPWWQTWWAVLLYIVSVASIGYSFYHFQLSQRMAAAERKRLKEINQLKTRLYTNITHEFRTPLTIILGMTDNLKSTLGSLALDGVDKSLALIHKNGESLLHLVNEMLDLAKLESGNLKLEMEQGDIVPFINALCESFHSNEYLPIPQNEIDLQGIDVLIQNKGY